MKLSKTQKEKLRNLDIIKATHEARDEACQLINDQGFTVFALLISNFISELAENPDKVIKEYSI